MKWTGIRNVLPEDYTVYKLRYQNKDQSCFHNQEGFIKNKYMDTMIYITPWMTF